MQLCHNEDNLLYDYEKQIKVFGAVLSAVSIIE